MANLAYSKLKLKVDNDVNTVEILGSDGVKFELEIKKYIGIKEKINLVTRVVENSVFQGVVRNDFLDMYLHLELVKLYTNLTFTEKKLENDLELFDELSSNGIIQTVIDQLSEDDENDEYGLVIDYIQHYAKQLTTRFDSSLQGYTAKTEGQAEILKGILDDPSMVELVADIANSTAQ